MAEFLQVPGNVKQLYAPFVLDPTNGLFTTPIAVNPTNKGANTDTTATVSNQEAQVFTFKPKNLLKTGNKRFGKLKIFPNSFDAVKTLANDDLSYKSLFGYQKESKYNKNQVDFEESILNNLPAIQIREYLHDAKLDQLFNLFSSFSVGWNSSSQDSTGNFEISEFAKKIWNTSKFIISHIDTLLKRSVTNISDADLQMDFSLADIEKRNDYFQYIIRFPYMMYYRMQSSTTTNLYEIPYNGQFIDVSDGNNGWNTNRGIKEATTDGKSTIGNIINYFGKNIRVNMTPTWDGAEQSTPLEIKVDFDLYNDTDEAALINFIFLNTLVPGSKWLQYHIFQHAPNLYDIKIDGITRLFMCTGKFEVTSKGVFRLPSRHVIEKLVNNHMNKNFKGDINYEISNNIIKIPDIYSFSLTFTSLLPNNLNNYLYGYYMNSNIITSKAITSENLHTNSAFNKMSEQLTKDLKAVYTYIDRLEFEDDENQINTILNEDRIT